MGKKVNLKNVRVAWLHVFKKKPGSKPDEKPAFRMDIIIDKEDRRNLGLLEDAALEVMTEAFKDEKVADRWLKKYSGLEGHIDRDCAIKDGDERDNVDENYEGKIYVTSKSFKQPRIKTSEGEDVIEVDGEIETVDGDEPEGQIPYGGCFCNVSIELWGQNNDKGKGLRCNLLGLKFVDDGEAFGGSGSGETATDDDLEDEPRGKSKSKAKAKSKPSRRSRDEDDEDEDDRPRKSKRRRDEDDEDDEDERPRKSKRRSRDEDDEDEEEEAPRRRRRPRDEEEEDEEDEDERPRRRRR